jgi:hypothetical protein
MPDVIRGRRHRQQDPENDHLPAAPHTKINQPEAYHRGVPEAEVHVLDAGHFALDTAANEIATLIRNFLGTSR